MTQKSPLKDLHVWVKDTFVKDQMLVEQRFNVKSYSIEQINDAIASLTAEGFRCSLENNNNSLNVKA